MKINFEYVTNLQYEVKALRAKVKAYETGEAHLRQQEEYEKKQEENSRIWRMYALIRSSVFGNL